MADDGPWHEPLLWYAEKPAAPGTWKALGAPAARAGLLPVLVDTGGGVGGPHDWVLLPGETSYPGDHDAEDVLAEYWEEETEDGEIAEEIEPFGEEWPGLAPATAALAADPDTRAAQVADALVGDPESDVEDCLLYTSRDSGWTGPVNYEGDVARICAVLRSWEDRFGIRVVALGPDVLVVSVAAPPATREEAEALAAEHFALCPDNVLQGERDTLGAYAKSLIGAPSWTFWWD